MLGAGLGYILPWKVVPGAFIWLALVLAGYAMWRFARDYLPAEQAAGAGFRSHGARADDTEVD